MTQISFEQLIAEHRRIDGHARALTRAIEQRAGATALHALLGALRIELTAHLATEDEAIYPLLIASPDQGAASAAREAVAQFATLAAEWDAFFARSTRAAIARDEDAFARDYARLLDRLGGRIRCENELLYPMALRAAHIRLRAA